MGYTPLHRHIQSLIFAFGIITTIHLNILLLITSLPPPSMSPGHAASYYDL